MAVASEYFTLGAELAGQRRADVAMNAPVDRDRDADALPPNQE
jgi:hypothetical protein